MTTINVLDSAGLVVPIEKPLVPGRSAAATSRPVALSTEDKAAVDALATQVTAAAILAKIIAAPATEAKQDAAIAQETAAATVLGVAADAASATTTIKAALRGMATALGITALDLGTGTGGSRTLRWFQDTAQWIGGAGAVGTAVQRTTLASDDPAVAVLGTTAGAAVTTSAAGTIQGYLRGIVSLLVSGITANSVGLPASLGQKTAANSTSVVLSSDGPFAANFGITTDAKSTATDTTAATAISIWKQISASVQSLVAGTVLAAGSALIGRAVADASAAAGGITTTARMPSAAASTNGTLVKASAGRIYSVCGKNNAAYDVFLVLYDAVTNPPVPGTTTIRKKIPCPAGAAFVYDFPLGLYCATGIGYAFTKLVADADTTVLVAADITAFNMDYV